MTPKHTTPLFPTALHPRYWLTWLGLLLLGMICWLPWHGQRALAFLLSRLLYHLAKRRKAIAQTNVTICFKNMTNSAQAQLVKDIFFENTLGLFETGMVFFRPKSHFKRRVQLADTEQHQLQTALERAQNSNRGIILIGAHYSTLDMGGLLFSFFFSLDVIYRPHNNPVFNVFLLKSRQKWAQQVIPHLATLKIVRSLKQGHIFWFPADQDYGVEHSVFAPFFGQPAASITTPNRLHHLTKSEVFIIGHHRASKALQYQIHITPIAGFPFASDIEAATAVNTAIEHEIKRHPAQYMWVHRRFKHQPDQQKIYDL